MKRLAELLGVKKTVLGVDIYANGEVTLDVDEKTIFKIVKDWQNTWIVLSPIGHQDPSGKRQPAGQSKNHKACWKTADNRCSHKE